MPQYSQVGREPLRSAEPQTPQRLSHRIASFAEITDLGANPYDLPGSPLSPDREPALSPRTGGPEISLGGGGGGGGGPLGNDGRSQSHGNVWAGRFAYSSNGGYAPLTVATNGSDGDNRPPLPHRPSGGSSHSSLLSPRMRTESQTTDSEEYDMSLLRSAAPMGGVDLRHDSIPEEGPPSSEFEPNTPIGPLNQYDENFIRKLQNQEAQGRLTGGLGQGMRPQARLRDQELLTPTSPGKSMARSFSRRLGIKGPGRGQSIREAGQDAANRRGEVIEVIVERAETDISTIEGPLTMASDETRRSTFVPNRPGTQIFYPQPNWKPFSMRWPWLTMLIVLSLALAGMQEFLFQRYSGDNPLLRFKKPEDVEPGLYFMTKFGPTLIAVVYGVLWQFTDFEVRRLEAYYQMSRPGGALAAESINVDYVTSFSFFRPFRALKVGHTAVALSSMATTFAVSLVPTFAAASLVLTPSRAERNLHPNDDKEILFSPIWSRLLLSTLLVNAVAGCGLFYLLQARRSGLVGDVRGIAGLASMAVVSHILMDFKDTDTIKPKDIHHKLKHHRYILRNSSLAPDDENPPTSRERDKYHDRHFDENPHPLMLRMGGSIPFLIALVLFIGFIPAFLFTPADVVTDKAPWAITAMAVGIKLSWNALETAVRMMEPYYILSRRHAPSKTLTLDYTAVPFGYLPIQALFNGHILMFLVGFGTVMAEWMTVLVTSLATVDGRKFVSQLSDALDHDDDENGKKESINSGRETLLSFYLSLALTLFILVYMMTVATIVFVRRRHPFLPRQPNTIASILAFIHQSKMLYNFVKTNELSNSDMTQKLNDGTTYGLGWFVGRDGQTHCGVDQEELLSDYKHGLDVSQGNQPWNMQWDVL